MSGRAATTNVIPGKYALSVGLADMRAPKGWCWVSLGDVARLESGHTPSREHPEYWDGGIPWIGIKDARTHHGGTVSETFQTVTKAGIDNSAARLLPAATVCLSRTASVGYVVVMGKEMATSQDFVNWSCGPALEPHFLKQLLIAENESLFRFGKGSTHTTIYYPEVKAFHVCLPPLNEQRRIVAKLEALQVRSRRAREALEAVPPLLEKLRQSILAAAFRGDLTKDWRAQHPNVEPASELLKRIRVERRRKWEEAELAKMRAKGKGPADDRWKARYKEPEPVDATGLPELPGGWCWLSIEELCDANAPAVYGIILPGDDVPDGIPYVRPLDMFDDGSVNFETIKRTSLEIATQYSRASLRRGDVVLSIVGTIGKVIVVPPQLDGGNITQSSARIRPPPWMPSAYLSHALRSPVLSKQFDLFRFGNAVQRLNVDHVRRLAIPVAPHHESALLLHRIQKALALAPIKIVERLRSDFRQLESAMLAKAFRGELVPQDPNDEPAEAMLARLRAEKGAAPEKRAAARGGRVAKGGATRSAGR